ncbi:MAG: cytochrome ubiquinol oxidase subunit I [Planctomycetia bacterium]|nr:cytochrome ubiquinol oxidase subunit I [Planctomycetia bacterium]
MLAILCRASFDLSAIVVGQAGVASDSGVLAARLLMALTLAFHIVFASLGVGLPVLLLLAEWRYLRSRDELWKTLARRWSKAFAVLFAVGAVSGTVLSFELGMLWPEFVRRYGSVIGLPFTLEAFAFFLEAIFAGIYFYGWDRLRPWAHWWSGVPIALGGVASAWFVVAANAWMNVPQGFRVENGVVADADPIAAMLNPATGAQTVHMIVAAYLVTGFLVASYYALSRLRGKATAYGRRAMGLGLVLGCVLAPVQVGVGHWMAQVVARTQPVKLAAMEGQFQTQAGAPLRLGGVPDAEARVTRYAVEIPGGLSWLAYADTDAVVRGLDEFPRQDTPPVLIVHVSFQVMVLVGMFLVALAGWGLVPRAWRRAARTSRAWLWVVAAAGPLSVLGLEAGWIVTEVGRQPWIVQGHMRTAAAATGAPGVGWVLAAAAAIYAILAVGTIVVLRRLAAAPLAKDASDVP